MDGGATMIHVSDTDLNVEQRIRSIKHVLRVVILVVVFFILFNFSYGRTNLALFEASVVIFLMIPALLAISYRPSLLHVSENALMLASALVLVYVMYDGGVSNRGIIWILAFPFIAFYFKGIMRGWFWIAGILAIMSMLIILQIGAISTYKSEDWWVFLVAFLFYSTIAHISNDLRARYQVRLEREVKKRTATIRHNSLHETLTNLPNRSYLHQNIQDAINHGLSNFSILSIDIDRFNEINTILGFRSGNKLLRELGERIRLATESNDFVAHLGGDEFAVVFHELSSDTDNTLSLDNSLLRAEKIRQSIEQPYKIESGSIDIISSMGLELHSTEIQGSNHLIRRADSARRVAKQEKRGISVYDKKQDLLSIHHLELFSGLKQAITKGELTLNYQPKIDSKSNRISDVECLVRWIHPKKGMITPDDFIPMAESTGLITPLTNWVLEEAFKQKAVWQENGINIGVAINLSARNLADSDMPGMICSALHSRNLSADSITLEITESAIMESPDATLKNIRKLREIGFNLSLDDYGTGYSSLAYIKDLPVNELKIDKSFILNINEDGEESAIIRSTIGLAHDLNLKVVAEGVENIEAWNKLKAMGCDKQQGYYMCKPLSSEDLLGWLKTSEWGLS
jgi:diguanylate cyclase (GGDEF)-like protein